MVTRSPRHFRSRPSEEAVRPFPRELDTPPVTKMNLLTPPDGRQPTRRLIGAPDHDNRHRAEQARTPVDLSNTCSVEHRGTFGSRSQSGPALEQLASVGPGRVAVGMAREHA